MCPIRIILVFFSALLAGYFAWKTAHSSSSSLSFLASEASVSKIATPMALLKEKINRQEFGFNKVIKDGLLVLVNMMNGRYLWRHIFN
ncbi:hypothetical protein Scep_004168 [Stephania cephalantha]|uniref:Uncharacterized protein n=1 Tax=Stephania cephalantha TaxID=152367 RepID=A0AAP0KTJ4_9MAGN